MKKITLVSLSVLAMAFAVSCSSGGSKAPSAQSAAQLEEGFANPPQEARPRVWWHWMNGNITKDGALKDIEWMHRIGIGGFQTFDAGLTTPQIVDHRIIYMTDEWKDVFKTITEKANEYGMEMAIASSPGWSETGGPWVEPQQAMKKVVWSELDVPGGQQFKGVLPHPPVTTGMFANIPAEDNSYDGKSGGLPEYYEDFAVVAIKTAAPSISALAPKVSSTGGKFDLASLTDGDLVKSSLLPFGKPGTWSYITYEFAEPQTIYGAEVVGGEAQNRFAAFMGPTEDNSILEYSEDGVTYKEITKAGQKANNVTAVSFPAVTAKYFRLGYKAPVPVQVDAQSIALAAQFGISVGGPAPKGAPVAEFNLYTVPRVNRFIEKAGFVTATDLYAAATPSAEGATAESDVVVLTDKMDKDGNIDWTPTEGNWKILRFGYTLTGHQNSPASPEATGLECDKLDADAVSDYLKNYLAMYADASGDRLGSKGIQYLLTDSWEAGCLNWTGKMFEDFQEDAGYDLHTWLPALAGYVVGSPEKSDKFLWDYRKTISDLIAHNHYDLMTTLLKDYDMERYSESHENGRAYVVDGMQVKKNAAVPMAAMWIGDMGGMTLGASGADIREASSTAHIYGQKYVAAESLTAGGNAWGYYPENLKATADKLMANGLNRFVIHESAHQPLDDYKPGLTLGIFGQWFNRHETWAEQANVWMDYMARSCYMLQQGNFVADVLYYYGEDSNITAQFQQSLPAIPEGYNFDFINADGLVNDIAFKNGAITAPSGNTYKVIALGDNAAYMSLPVAKKLLELVKAGAVVVGAKPVATPSLSDDDAEFQTVVNQMWSGEAVTKVGKGSVYAGDIKTALDGTGVQTDVTYSRPNDNTNLLYVHRAFDGIQIYWLDSRTQNTEDIDVTFRVNGLEPEIWNAVSGKIEKASYKMENGKTTVKVHFDPEDAVFVVFRSKTSAKEFTLPEKTISDTLVEGAWDVAFLNGMGTPEKTTFNALSDWSLNADKYIQYYSGSAVYSKKVNVSADQLGGQVILCLGSVKNLAEVTVNGQDLGIVWKAPWKVDITSAVKEGENDIEVKVTNLWVNRLIGDQRKDAGQFAHVTTDHRKAYEALEPSGLLGPVAIESVK